MGFPKEFKYSKDHEWLTSSDGKIATIGVTSFALDQLGDIVHIELPDAGEEFETGSTFGTIESTKTVSDLYLPVNGKILESNNDLLEKLETLTDDPYKEGWLVKVELKSENELKDLLSVDAYETFISEQDD